MITVLLVTYVLYRIVLIKRVEDKLDELRRQGYVVDEEDFLANLPKIPDEENAAIALIKVFPKFDTENTNTTRMIYSSDEFARLRKREAKKKIQTRGRLTNQGRMPPDLIKILGDYVTKHQADYDEVIRAVSMKKSFFNYEYGKGYTHSSPQLHKIGAITSLLKCAARYYCEIKDTEKTFQFLCASFNLWRTYNQNPGQYSSSTVENEYKVALDNLEETLPRINFTDEQYKSLQNLLLSSTENLHYKKTFKYDVLTTVSDTKIKKISTIKSLALYNRRSNCSPLIYGLLMLDDYFRKIPFFLCYHLFAIKEKDFLKCLKIEQLSLSALSLAEEKQISEMKKIDLIVEDLHYNYPLTRYLYSNRSRRIISHFIKVSQLRSAATSMAIERYSLKYGKLPDSLAQLAPEFIDSIPLDPFTGKSLLYRKTGTGYVVYSTGQTSLTMVEKGKTLRTN